MLQIYDFINARDRLACLCGNAHKRLGFGFGFGFGFGIGERIGIGSPHADDGREFKHRKRLPVIPYAASPPLQFG
jgi:hypothetical protein